MVMVNLGKLDHDRFACSPEACSPEAWSHVFFLGEIIPFDGPTIQVSEKNIPRIIVIPFTFIKIHTEPP